MRRKRRTNPAQLSLIFQPEPTAELVNCWRDLKSIYPGPVVFVVNNGYYVSLDDDAEAIMRLTGCASLSPQVAMVAASADQADQWFASLSSAGRSILICDPPDDPSQFLFT